MGGTSPEVLAQSSIGALRMGSGQRALFSVGGHQRFLGP